MSDFKVGDMVWDYVKACRGVVTEVDYGVEFGERGRHQIHWDGEYNGLWFNHDETHLVPYSNASSPDEVAIDEAGGSEKHEPFKVQFLKHTEEGFMPVSGTMTAEPYKPAEVRCVSSTGAAKELKPARHSLIPTAALNLLAEHYGKGAAKYGDTPDEPNWRKGYNWSQSYDALMRHATAFWGGEDLDPETELPHMSAVVFHAFSLLTFMQEHPEFDDRYKGDAK